MIKTNHKKEKDETSAFRDRMLNRKRRNTIIERSLKGLLIAIAVFLFILIMLTFI